MSTKPGIFPVVSAFILGKITVGGLTLVTRPSLSASLSGSGANACPRTSSTASPPAWSSSPPSPAASTAPPEGAVGS